MQSSVPLDYAVFQLSPRRSRCELFVSYDGTTEKLASGLVKPFVAHLKVAEEQVAFAGKSIKLDVEQTKNAATWFTKGTLERFVRFVSTPEVLEMLATYDAEMSQLEAARKIYSQGAADHESGTSGGNGNSGVTAAFDATKMELLRAIDVRLSAVKQALTTACTHASAAGFNPKTVSELQFFADHFGSHRLSNACSKFITLARQHSDIFNSDNPSLTWKTSSDSVLHSSVSSDMSLHDPFDDHPKPSTCAITKVTLPSRQLSQEPSPSPSDDVDERVSIKNKDSDKDSAMSPSTSATSESASTSAGKPQLTRRPSVQDRINLFENKAQNSPSTSDTTSTSTGGKPELQRIILDVNSSTDKAVLRRWSGSSNMSIDVSGKGKEPDCNENAPTPSGSSSRIIFSPKLKGPSDPKSQEGDKYSKPPLPLGEEFGSQSAVSHAGESLLEAPVSSELTSKHPSFSGKSLEKDQYDDGEIWSRTASFSRGDDFGFGTQSTSNQVQLKSWPGKITKLGPFIRSEGELGSMTSEVNLQPEIRSIGVELDPVPAQPRCQSLSEIEKYEGSDFESLKSQMTRRGVGKESGSMVGGGKMGSTVQSKFKTREGFSSPSSASNDQILRESQAKGALGEKENDELKVKAKELEKLFAEHKVRVPGYQSSSAWRIRDDVLTSKQETDDKPAEVSREMDSFNTTTLSKTVDNHNHYVAPKQYICSPSFSDGSKGKLYQKYMKRRDARLREDWSSSRPEKEVQMKAMHDSLEKIRAEMKVKLAGSAVKRDSAFDTRQRAENLKSCDTHSAMKRDQPTDVFMSVKDSSSKSTQGKRVLPNKITTSPTTRNSTTPIHQSSSKSFKPGVGRRRTLYGNRLAQSAPNFSDLRKENTSPSSGGSKPAHVQEINHARKKKISEDLCLANEAKSRRLQSSKKHTPTTMEMNTSRYPDDVDDSQFMPSKYHIEKNADYGKLSDMESKALLIKGNGISKASVMRGAAGNEHGFGDASFGAEEMIDLAKDQEQEYETIVVEESTYVDNSKGRLSNESDKSKNSGYQNNDALSRLRFVSQAEDFPISMPTLFHSKGSTSDSPGESPVSWNLRLQNPFAYSHEISDIDASDSPSGSSTSWNLYTLSQTEAEADKMRKKWGAVQRPVVGVDSCHSYSRKDVTRGLRRFLKFGRKNDASESVADWISATTSEGDDSEDGRDLTNRWSEDLRKSRMGFSQNHNSDEGFSGSDMFNEQVQGLRTSIPTTPTSSFKLRAEHLSRSSLKAPKSFFSLSNFRNKANESKAR